MIIFEFKSWFNSTCYKISFSNYIWLFLKKKCWLNSYVGGFMIVHLKPKSTVAHFLKFCKNKNRNKTIMSLKLFYYHCTNNSENYIYEQYFRTDKCQFHLFKCKHDFNELRKTKVYHMASKFKHWIHYLS